MKKKTKGSRPWSRVLATQALYQLSINKNIDISLVKKFGWKPKYSLERALIKTYKEKFIDINN